MLVVGPSGAGKDSLIAGARLALAADAAFAFPRREITRPPGQPGEDYVAVTPEEFDRREAAGGYCLSWRAHGLAYGVPREVFDLVAAGRCAVVNASRAAVDEARMRFPRLRVLHVIAPAELLAARLQQRGRENGAGVVERLARASAITVAGSEVTEFVNDQPLDLSVAAFVQRLKG